MSEPPLREVIRRFGLGANKRLGQHFLLDRNLLARIARSGGDLTGRRVLEIGPGPGGLTRALLETDAAAVIAVERDARFLPALGELAAGAGGRLRVVHDDALALNERALGPPFEVVANLPYNIATPLWLKWLDRLDLFTGFTLLLQKEVALRLAAVPGGADWGRLAVKTSRLVTARRLFDVPARAFVPPPKVTSSVLRLVPRPAPLAVVDATAFDRVLAAAFGQRRKMLRTSLRALGGDPAALLATAGIDPTARPETLDVPAFARLAHALAGAQVQTEVSSSRHRP
jgi:16S rRNA (adenine1518-N6/adenine1519-N6)-dimethyltransferase